MLRFRRVVRGIPAFALVSIVLQLGVAHAQINAKPAVVEQPRPFGYVVGDLLTQRVLLENAGRAVEPVSMPLVGRAGVWFDRRAVRIDTQPDGRRWLAIEYQVINAPGALTTVRLPAWELKTKPNGLTLRVAEWPISVGPLTEAEAEGGESYGSGVPSGEGARSTDPPVAAGGAPSAEGAPPLSGDSTVGLAPLSVELRPDRAAPRIPLVPIQRRLFIWSSALVVTLIAWLGWLLWRNHRAATHQPFALAFREMRRTADTSAQAWQALHRAFDRTAGQVVQSDTLPVLFQRAPHLASLREAIEQFFTQSSERFFGSGAVPNPISARALCDDLRRLERRHER